jgi:hypothetical protein
LHRFVTTSLSWLACESGRGQRRHVHIVFVGFPCFVYQ